MIIKRIGITLLFFSFTCLLMAKEKTPTDEQQQLINEKAEDIDKYGTYYPEWLELIVEFGQENQQDEARKELARRKAAVAQKIMELQAELEQIKKGNIPGKDPEDVNNQINNLFNQYDEISEILAKAKEDNHKTSENNKNGEEAATPGDPVRATDGRYLQSETDIEKGSLIISRNYESGKKIESSFGLGWNTNLDERLILGIDPDSHRLYKAKTDYADNISKLIAEYTETIKTTLEVSSVENAENEINERIRKCENIRASAVSIDGNYGVSAGGVISSADNTISRLKDNLKLLARYKKELKNLKEKYSQAAADAQKYKEEVVDKCDERHGKNRFALFSGMDPSYEETGLETITVIDENGFPHLLKETSKDSGIWENTDDKSIRECRITQQRYKVTSADGSVKEYDAYGFLVKKSDRNQNYVLIERNNNSEKIVSIQNSYGEFLSFIYDGKYIAQIVNERDRTEKVIYSYTGNKLTKVTDTDGDDVVMDYDSDGYMISLNKCDGSKIQFVYGLEKNGKKLATATINEEEYSETFDYENSQTIYSDHDQNKTVYVYDSKQRTIEEYHADGTWIKTYYDDKKNIKTVNENGYSITYKLDEWGNTIKASYKDGSEENWTYDLFNQMTSYKDRDGVVYEYNRDGKGNLIEYKVNGKKVYRQKVNEKGQVVQRTVCGQNEVTTDYVYDDNGNLKSQTCDSVKTEYEYDKRNRVKRIKQDNKTITEYVYEGRNVIQKDYNGLETTYVTNGRKDMTEVIQKDTVTGVIHKTRIEYDRRHLPLCVYNGDGQTETLVSSYLYTPGGNLKAQIRYGSENWITLYEYKNGSISEVKQFKTPAVVEPVETTFTEETLNQLLLKAGENVYTQKYDHKIQSGNKKLLTVTDGLGIQSLFEYDSSGNLVKTTDGNREARSVSYSKAGRVNGEQSGHGGWYRYEYEDGNLWKAGEENGSYIQSTYYSDGSQKSITDRYGKTTYYNYDNRGRVSNIISDSQKVWYEYDNFDRVTKQLIGNTPDEYSVVYYVTYDYSDDGRTITVTEGGKYKTISVVDAFGNVIKQTDGKGNTRRYEYNSQNQLTKSYDGYENETNYEYNALGNVSLVVQPDGAKTEYLYNYMGLLEKVTDDCGIVYTASYDKAGRLVKEKSRADSEKSYEYDNGGRITKVLCGGEVVESYNYGPDSRTVTVKDGNSENYIYNYDTYGRLTDEINRKGLSQSYIYDSDGQMKGQTNFDGSTTTIVYSSDRTVRTVNYSDGSENRFVYDSLGNIIEAQNAYGKTLYQYDQGGRLIYQKDVTTGEEIRFYYDDAGNRIKLLSSNRETIYTYGQNSEVKEIFDNKQRLSVKLAYDKNGREVLRKFGNGTSETTLYDKAGRVTVKAQKSDRGELQWAEGYLYGSDGKRTATVDNKGSVTLYEYNKKGQLETVYYPYSQEMINLLKSEAEENGLPVNAEPGENRYLSSDIKNNLVRLMNSMQFGISGSISNLQIFIKESYGYDKNGNRITKTTKYGTINYNYDKENCLVSSGSRGQTFVTYTYDNMGNLLTEESALKSTKYAYNSQNRLIYCEVTDKSKKEYAQTSYAYDAFGRRILVQDKGEAALRTLYDGLTFDVIKQSPTFENGLYTDSQNTGIQWGRTGKPTGERYRYISDENAKDDARYVYLDENAYRIKNTRYTGERTQLTVNGTLAAQSSTEGTQYFTTDLFGSVSTVSDSSGYQLDSYTYDAFGSLVQGDLTGITDLGYLGKQNDPTSRLYNYGYRDYASQSARFTTVDPIRDGSNWFAYVNNDPVNFVDLWGLAISGFSPFSSMSTYKKENINNTSSTISDSGCAMTGISNIISEVIIRENHKLLVYNPETHEGAIKIVTPVDLNKSKNFYENTDELIWNEAVSDYGLTATRSNSKENAQEMIKNAERSKGQEYVLIQVPITVGSGDDQKNILHWVGHKGRTIIENGQEWIEIVATSDNDKYRHLKNDNWMEKDGKMYVKETAVEGAVVIKKKNK